MSLKRTLGEKYGKYKVRVGRGSTFTAEVEGVQNALTKGGILILVVQQYTGWLAPIWILPIAWVIQKSFEYFMGWLDEKHLGWWRYEQDYVAKNINPWQQEVSEILKKIHEK